ncbi:hypothetical protein PM082_022014 [Marasmius tenuissimus]|nr:hypothetical protein PM082_022014 [Marasmius tenuissimus]
MANTPYDRFLCSIAELLPCAVEDLAESSIHWKPKKPACAKDHLVGNEDGYSALINHVLQEEKGRHILLYMDPPSKPSKPIHESEPEGMQHNTTSSQAKTFDFAALEYSSTANHISQQRANINKNMDAMCVKLEARYPVGNIPEFPNKRVFKNKNGHMWELGPLELNCWMSHMDQARHLRTPKSSQAPVLPNAPPPPVSAPLTPSAAMPDASHATSQLMSVIALWLLTDMATTPAHAVAAPAPTLVSPAPVPAAFHPPSPIKHYKVPLAMFCTRYKLSKKDQACLLQLCCPPGDNNIHELTDSDWCAIGFQKLEWLNTVKAHDLFVHENKMGEQ